MVVIIELGDAGIWVEAVIPSITIMLIVHNRKSNLFTPNKKESDKSKDKASTSAEEFGSGRAIPIKQGFLYKKSQKALSREWKKKYCTLSEGI